MNKNFIFSIIFSIILFSNFGLSSEEVLDTTLGNVLSIWESWGIFDIFLPLILIYLIVFLAFYKAKIFASFEGEERKFSAITAFIVSAISLVPHIASPASRFDVIYIINNALPKITLTLTMIIFILVLYGVLFGPMKDNGPIKKNLMAWISIILIIFIFIDSALGEEGWIFSGTFSKIKNLLGTEDLLAFTFFIVLGVVMWFITKPTSKDNSKKNKKKEFKLVSE